MNSEARFLSDFSLSTPLYLSMWVEKGLGEAQLLLHKRTGKVRFLQRQEKTAKTVADFNVPYDAPCCQLQNAGSEKRWTWRAFDCSAGESKDEWFVFQFACLTRLKTRRC